MNVTELRKEAELAILAGEVEKAVNPVRGSHEWTVDEVLDGIREGVVDGWRHGGPLGLFNGDPLIGREPIVFKDAALGRRVGYAILWLRSGNGS